MHFSKRSIRRQLGSNGGSKVGAKTQLLSGVYVGGRNASTRNSNEKDRARRAWSERQRCFSCPASTEPQKNLLKYQALRENSWFSCDVIIFQNMKLSILL